MMNRRKLICSAATGTAIALSGCSERSEDGESLSWGEAFKKEMSDEDYDLLEPTPIVADEVTTESDVKTALAVLGWTIAVSDLTRYHLDDLEELEEVSATAMNLLSPTVQRLDEGLSLVDEMKDTSVASVSVWDAAVAYKPSLEEFEFLARTLQDQLESFFSRAESVHTTSIDAQTHITNIGFGESLQGGGVGRQIKGSEAGNCRCLCRKFPASRAKRCR